MEGASARRKQRGAEKARGAHHSSAAAAECVQFITDPEKAAGAAQNFTGQLCRHCEVKGEQDTHTPRNGWGTT